MAFVSGSQGSGLLGRVFTALGNSRSPDLRHIALSPQADTQYAKLFGDYSSLLGNQKTGLADFSSQYKALTPQVAGLGQEDVGTYTQLLKNATARDPLADMRSIGDYGFGKLNEFGQNLAQYGTREDNLRKAAAGLGNRSPGTYDNLLATNRITGNLLPAFNNIISTIGPNFSRASQDYFQNLQAIPGLMQGRYNALDQAPFRALLPSQLEAANLQQNIGNLGNLTQGQLNNWSFYVKPNALQTAGNVLSGIYGGIFDAADAANKVSSAYSNVMTSGLGGMGGGMGGMGGQQPDLSGGSGLSTGQFAGESVGNPQATTAFVANPYQPAYSQYGIGYAQPPIQYGAGGLSAINGPMAPPYNYGVSYAQNPYSQYGAYFNN